MFETASILERLKASYFILHVPRACIECDCKGIRDALEHEILNEAATHNFALDTSVFLVMMIIICKAVWVSYQYHTVTVKLSFTK